MTELILDTLEITKHFESVGIDRKQAEVFAEMFKKTERVIIHEVNERDDAYATKADIREMKVEIKRLDEKIDALPDKIMWQIVKYGTALYAVIRVIELVIPIFLKKSGN